MPIIELLSDGSAKDTTGAVHELALVDTVTDSRGFMRTRDSMRLTPSFGAIWYRDIDFGFPDVRASMQDLAQADGSYDETQFTGSRTVTISGVVLQNAFGSDPGTYSWDPAVRWNSASWWCSYLSSWVSPARRLKLYFVDDSRRARFMEVRGDAFSSAISGTGRGYRDFQMSFVNPSGRIYTFDFDIDDSEAAIDTSTDSRSAQLIDVTGATTPGREYPEPGPYSRNYPPGNLGGNYVPYKGTVPNGFICQIYTGTTIDLEAPRLTIYAPDGSSQSIGLRDAGEAFVGDNRIIVIDTVQRTIGHQATDGSDYVPLEQHLEAPLQWPQLRPGTVSSAALNAGTQNRVTLTAEAIADDASVDILWFDADLT